MNKCIIYNSVWNSVNSLILLYFSKLVKNTGIEAALGYLFSLSSLMSIRAYILGCFEGGISLSNKAQL